MEDKSLLLHDLYGQKRWEVHLQYLKETLNQKKSAIVILPDIESVSRAKERLSKELNSPISTIFRKSADELLEWQKARNGQSNIVIGTRSAVFTPLRNLGLIIVDEEENSVYKQDQVPHYHCRDIALKRAGLEGAKVILGSVSPTLESFYLAKNGELEYQLLPSSREFPEVKVIDMKSERRFRKERRPLFSKYLLDTVLTSITSGEKVLLFLNRK